MSIKQHMTDHLSALRRGDIDALLAHYNEQSVLIHQQGIARGLSEIKAMLEFFLSNVIPPASTTLDLQVEYIYDNVGYIAWASESDLFTIEFATDTMVFDGDIIAVQTSAGIMIAKE
jgi:ketosteroid isomerase-like protein